MKLAFILLALFQSYSNQQITPLSCKFIPIQAHPIVYAYTDNNSLRALTQDGWLFTFTPLNTPLDSFSLKDSINIGQLFGIDGNSIIDAAYDGRSLFILTNRELLITKSDTLILTRLKVSNPIMVSSYHPPNSDIYGSSVAVLTENKLYLFSEGHLIDTVKLKLPFLYINFLKADVVVASGKGSALFYNFENHKHKIDSVPALKAAKLLNNVVAGKGNALKSYVRFLRPHLASVSPDGRTFVYLGAEEKKDSLISYIAQYDLSSMELIDIDTLVGKVAGIWTYNVSNRNWVIISKVEDITSKSYGRTYIYKLIIKSLTPDSGSFYSDSGSSTYNLVVDVTPLDRNHLMVSYFPLSYTSVGYDIIPVSKDSGIPYISKRFSGVMRRDVGSIPFLKYEERIFFLACSNWVDTLHKVYAIVPCEIGLDEIKDVFFVLKDKANSFRYKYFKTTEAYIITNKLLQLSSSFFPSYIDDIQELNNSIERIMKIKKILKGIGVFIFIKFLPIATILFYLFRLLRTILGEMPPRGETLRILQGNAIWHSIKRKIDEFKLSDTDNPIDLKKVIENLDDLIDSADRARKVLQMHWNEFVTFASFKWMKLFVSNIFLFRDISKTARRLKRCLEQEECNEKEKAKLIKRLGKLKEKAKKANEYKEKLISEVQMDLLKDAISPAIESCRRYIDEVFKEQRWKAPKIITNINLSDQFRLYPDEITRLRSSLESILHNAVDAIKQAVDKWGTIDNYIKIDVKDDVEGVVITIEDSGIGIDLTDIERIFRPGYSTKSGKGRGHGLDDIKEFFEKIGSIDIQHGKDRGTMFILKISQLKLNKIERRKK